MYSNKFLEDYRIIIDTFYILTHFRLTHSSCFTLRVTVGPSLWLKCIIVQIFFLNWLYCRILAFTQISCLDSSDEAFYCRLGQEILLGVGKWFLRVYLSIVYTKTSIAWILSLPIKIWALPTFFLFHSWWRRPCNSSLPKGTSNFYLQVI